MKSKVIFSFLISISIILAFSILSYISNNGETRGADATVVNTTTASDKRIASNNTSYLFILSALSGSLTPIDNDTTNSNQVHKLILNNVTSTTFAFSDKPDRIVNLVDTQTFVDNWNKRQDDFESDPSNAALSLNVNGQEEIRAFELLQFDKQQKTLRYDVLNLDNSTKFGTATLFIDAGCSPLDPRGC